jgi:6-phosphogluconolactonase (cycloisomerase 2 family)
MRSFARLATAGGIAMAATALLTGTGLAATQQHGSSGPSGQSAGEVFVQTDNTSGNAVIVYNRNPDGTLSDAGSYQTGGLGGVLNGSVVDHLASQGSLAYDQAHGLLYAVNAGSNTVTVFSVAGGHLVRQQVISSGGDFPVSIALHGNLVYVLNARDGGSVQGFVRVGSALVQIPGSRRALGLNAAQTPEFTSTPGQVAFTPDGSKLIVTTKKNGNDIDVFSVNSLGGLSVKPVVNADPDAVPFAVSFDAGGHLAVAEAGTGTVATFTVNRDGTLTLVDRVATGQLTTCWIAPAGTAFYASNAGSGSLSGYTDNGSGTLQPLGNTSTDPGTVDAAASPGGQYLYAQTGGKGIVDEYRVNARGSLTEIGSVTVPGAVGGEGIAAS